MALHFAVLDERTFNPIKRHNPPLNNQKDTVEAPDSLVSPPMRYPSTYNLAKMDRGRLACLQMAEIGIVEERV